MILEQDLIDLGFERTDETTVSSGSAQDWHYYTLDIGIDVGYYQGIGGRVGGYYTGFRYQGGEKRL